MSKRKDIERAKGGSPFRNIPSKVVDKVQSLVEKAVSGKIKGKNLDEIALSTIKQYNIASKAGFMDKGKLRTQVIDAAGKDIAKCIKKNMTDEDILKPVYASPNYLKLLATVDLNIDHLQAIINEKRADSIRPY